MENDTGMTPKGNTAPGALKWPVQTYQAMTQFYGEPGENLKVFTTPFPLRLSWEPSKTITRISANAKIVEPLTRIWTRTLEHYGLEEIKRLGLDLFGGCFNNRPMRGGSTKSTHAWGAAVDIDPDHNQLKWGRDKARLAKPEYETFWEFVEDEGAVSLGRARNFDWMHFQFARLKS